MGTSLRVFLVNDDDSIERLPMARYERLLSDEQGESCPQYAGRQIRYALVMLTLVDRKPVEIEQIQYSFLSFDSEGRLDPAEQEKESRLAMEILPPVSTDPHSQQVIDARHYFARRRYESKYTWKPTHEIEEAIVGAVFGNDLF